ncbi:MAG: class I SAM-dependent DNA methyltransferase [Bacteroidetes bacterium]|nr:class I SAM-dependent DNA methyltransferase [Bacteroidota bacterium]
MPLSLNEIRARAATFAHEWADAFDEDAEAKSFWDGFFRVFGQERRQVAMFEKFVKKLNNKQGFIDLFWPGKLVVEHKSKGKNLDKAFDQATEYFTGLKTTEYPKYVIVSDFARIRLYDLDNDNNHEITLAELPEKVDLFKFIAGYEQTQYKEQDPANIEAAELMGKLHDAMLGTGYEGHVLEVYLVRMLFCLFAEDSNIFEKYQFQSYIEDRTHEDGSDLGSKLAELFYVLNTETKKRLNNLDEQLSAFAYVNGKLFEEMLPPASFDRKMRDQLLECCSLDWSRISPAIFGSLFQSVMDKNKRRNLGAHYTSEKNILKLIKPLFLDELQAEFETIKGYKNTSQRKSALNKFHDRIASLRFLDPACGCGNFLIVSYRELRLLELEIIKELQGLQYVTDVSTLVLCDVGQFYGIEIEEFPSQIAQVALWLMDHQMNLRVSDMFGLYFARLPLKSRPHIANENALHTNWQSLIEPMPWDKKTSAYDYILGNPPFSGAKVMDQELRNDVIRIFDDAKGAGTVDFVAAWYLLAAKYIRQFSETKAAFVSTNSVTQGEQVGVIWHKILEELNLEIQFAYQTFKWQNEAKGLAAVHCVIVGFSEKNNRPKRLFIKNSNDGTSVLVKNINPYLVEGRNVFILSRKNPLCNVRELGIGNKPIDGGAYLFTRDEKYEFIKSEPLSKKYFKRWLGSDEFINGKERWCLYLGNINPDELNKMPHVIERVQMARRARLNSKAEGTRKLAENPTKFHVEFIPKENYLVIPEVSTERRKYIPIGYLSPEILSSNKLRLLPSASLYEFGILTSEMHMDWMRCTAGRMKSDYSYSINVVYNNFPWPENVSEAQKRTVEEIAQRILDIRASYHTSTLAVLYDPNTMPPDLYKAHQALDKAVDKCYRKEPFKDERERIEYLFGLYEKYTSGLLAQVKPKTGKKKVQKS